MCRHGPIDTNGVLLIWLCEIDEPGVRGREAAGIKVERLEVIGKVNV